MLGRCPLRPARPACPRSMGCDRRIRVIFEIVETLGFKRRCRDMPGIPRGNIAWPIRRAAGGQRGVCQAMPMPLHSGGPIDPFAPVFPAGTTVTVLCDDVLIADYIRRSSWLDVCTVDGLQARDNDPITNAILLCTTPNTPFRPEVRGALNRSRVLYVPLHVFDPSPEAAAYSLQRLAESDFAGALQRNRRWLRILEQEQCLQFVSRKREGIELVCTPADEIEVSTALSAALPPGVVKSIGLFFEVELERRPGEQCPFILNGRMHVDGICYAMPDDLTHDATTMRDQSRKVGSMASAGGLNLVIRDSTLVACTAADGTSMLNEVAAAVGGDLELSEFAIGTNRLLRPNFAINAQINEGAGGIHIGIGGTDSRLHMDFICLDARLISSGRPAGRA
jgi:hypothetical protein